MINVFSHIKKPHIASDTNTVRYHLTETGVPTTIIFFTTFNFYFNVQNCRILHLTPPPPPRNKKDDMCAHKIVIIVLFICSWTYM